MGIADDIQKKHHHQLEPDRYLSQTASDIRQCAQTSLDTPNEVHFCLSPLSHLIVMPEETLSRDLFDQDKLEEPPSIADSNQASREGDRDHDGIAADVAQDRDDQGEGVEFEAYLRDRPRIKAVLVG